MKRKENAPTMKDVAREAGVALGTVSKVFNDIPVPPVGWATRSTATPVA